MNSKNEKYCPQSFTVAQFLSFLYFLHKYIILQLNIVYSTILYFAFFFLLILNCFHVAAQIPTCTRPTLHRPHCAQASLWTPLLISLPVPGAPPHITVQCLRA